MGTAVWCSTFLVHRESEQMLPYLLVKCIKEYWFWINIIDSMAKRNTCAIYKSSRNEVRDVAWLTRSFSDHQARWESWPSLYLRFLNRADVVRSLKLKADVNITFIMDDWKCASINFMTVFFYLSFSPQTMGFYQRSIYKEYFRLPKAAELKSHSSEVILMMLVRAVVWVAVTLLSSRASFW